MVLLEIEPLRAEHASLLFPGLADARLYTFMPREPPSSAPALADEFRRLAKGPASGAERWFNWVMLLAGRPIGSLQATVQIDGVALIAYVVFVADQRKGYGSEGCRWLLRELFSMAEVRRVRAEIDTRNAASIRLVESVGLRQVSRVANADWFKGSASDEFIYELARPI